jgi:2-phosphosulfolactate phosphatase
MSFDQAQFTIRCEWGENGVAALAPISDAVIIVDVMSFSTAVSIATARGARVYPFRSGDESDKIEFAKSVQAQWAGHRGKSKYSLSPASLLTIPQGARLVLPSPNGSTLTLATGDRPTLAGCLRNAKAVARAALKFGNKIAVIPCGERWKQDESLRPSFEDHVGAGAIISHLPGLKSPEALAACAAFSSARPNLTDMLKQCSSGLELIAMGYESDIHLIADLDADDSAPLLQEGAYTTNDQRDRARR